MTQIGMKALRDFSFAGQAYERGQIFDASPVYAAAFVFQRWARFTTAADLTPAPVEKALTVEKKPITAAKRARQPRKPGTYTRRDIAPSQTK